MAIKPTEDGAKISSKTEQQPEQESPNLMLVAARIGSAFSSGVVGCGFLGWLLDRYFDTHPWGMLVMLFLGFGVGVLALCRMLGGYNQPTERCEPNGKED